MANETKFNFNADAGAKEPLLPKERSSEKSFRAALEPVFEKSFRNSVRKHPREITDAIVPVIGPAIRKATAVSIREFAESLNQIVEKSASLRSVRWRIEARVTGRPSPAPA